MPQDPESEAELKNLAAVPYQIISPGNNAAIIGIYQDSMLGSYRFTREKIDFTQKDAMNLLMMFNRVNPLALEKGRNERVSNFEILSQILPPLSLKIKNKQFSSEKEKAETSNNIVEIKDGKYIRGQMDKGILGSGSKGIIHRICNDFGNMASAAFIDDLQNIITEYMKQSAFSVGISDLITTSKTQEKIQKIITDKKVDVKNLIDQVQIGVFENNSGKSNEEEFESKITNILNNAQAEAGREALNDLSKDNRFVVMYNSGSKGSEINIQQMTACLGQQNVEGKRIPYGFEHRTLPHYTKYDDSPGARGFVESSYINGLSPQELFFHAMGGRIGLIDTAVKTSTTGYIQRRLIKGLEDLMVNYDMTIRSNKNKIVQFSYGDDSIDTVKVENQEIPIVEMSIQDIYAHFNVPEDKSSTKALSGMFVKSAYTRQKKQEEELKNKCRFYTDFMIENRDKIIKNIFNYKGDKVVRLPVAFSYIIHNIIGQQNINPNSLVDITMLEAYEMIEKAFKSLERIHFAPPTPLFKVMYYYYLSPKDLLMNKRFNKIALEVLLQTIILSYKRAIVAPGEMVGMIAAQSIGEPTTQMTLNTFHYAGVASKSNVTRGVPRIEEILSLTSKELKNPSLTVYLKPEDETDKDKANTIQYMLEHTKLQEIVKSIDICFDPDDLNTLIDEDKEVIAQYREFENMINECMENQLTTENQDKSKWIIRMSLDAETMLEKNITMDDVNFTLNNTYKDEISCVYSDYNSDNLVFRIRMNNIVFGSKSAKASGKGKSNPLDQSDQIYVLKNFQDQLLNNIVLRGIKNIDKVIMRKVKDTLVEKSGAYNKQDIWVLDTIGTNLLDVLGLDYVDPNRTYSNDIVEIFDVLGIEAARQSIFNELTDVIEFDGNYVNAHHMAILCDRMTYSQKLISISRHGTNNDDIGPIAKASFEETPEMFLKAARHAELDTMRGISANVMCGQEGFFGTASFQVVLDINEMSHLEEKYKHEYVDKDKIIEDGLFGRIEDPTNMCSTANLTIENNVANIKIEEMGEDNDYDPFA
jgi:DNA-directed RNA polymerase II subunit RPB1